MKYKKLCLASITSAFLFSPFLAQAQVSSNYEDAVRQATAAIDSARAANHEWRDSRKLLEKADKLNKEGKHDEAMRLVAEAEKQGRMALVQAELQAGVNGPH